MIIPQNLFFFLYRVVVLPRFAVEMIKNGWINGSICFRNCFWYFYWNITNNKLSSMEKRMIEVFMCMQKDIVSPDLDCIAEEVIKINETTKFRTFMCCCGHGIYSKTIIVVNPISGFFFDYPSGTCMRDHTKEPFYERDALGFLYNKETVEYYQKHPEKRRISNNPSKRLLYWQRSLLYHGSISIWLQLYCADVHFS